MKLTRRSILQSLAGLLPATAVAKVAASDPPRPEPEPVPASEPPLFGIDSADGALWDGGEPLRFGSLTGEIELVPSPYVRRGDCLMLNGPNKAFVNPGELEQYRYEVEARLRPPAFNVLITGISGDDEDS